MCFAAQVRALFQRADVFCTFWLGAPRLPKVAREWRVLSFLLLNVFAPQRRVWTSELPKVVREWCAFNIFTSICASFHNGVHCFDIPSHCQNCSVHEVFLGFWLPGVQFVISHLARWLHARHFSEPTFLSLRSCTTLEKHIVSRLFAHLYLLSADSFSSSSSLTLSTSAFSICP